MSKIGDTRYRRRKYPRRSIVALCDIFAPDMGKILGKGCVLNFSRGGLSVVTSTHISRGRPVGISVDGLHQKRWIAARVANVRNVTESVYSCGLKFEGLNLLRRNFIELRFKKLTRALLA